MQEELVTFQTAKLAKEKGFNEKCQYYYILDFSSFQGCTIPFKFSTPLENENIYQSCKLSDSQPHLSLAPTQSLLQRWLREVHNIDILVTSVNGNRLEKYVSKIYVDKYYTKLVGHSQEYENTFEKGLQEALKLIKNENT